MNRKDIGKVIGDTFDTILAALVILMGMTWIVITSIARLIKDILLGFFLILS